MKNVFVPLTSRGFFSLITAGLVMGSMVPTWALTPASILPFKTEAKQWVEGSEYYDLSLGAQAMQRNEPGVALNSLVTCAEKNPVNIVGLFQLGSAYLELAKTSEIPEQQAIYLEQAQQAYERVLTLNEDLVLTYFRLGKIALLRNQPAEAKRYYQMGIQIEPKNAALIFNLARVQDQMGERDQAIANYMHTLALDPKFTYAYNNLGLLYEETHQQEKAEKAYLHALKETPDYNLARLNLGNLYAAMGNYTLAEKTLSEAQRQEPKNEWVYYYQGNLHLRKGEYEQARAAYEQAIALNPEHATTYYLMAVALTKLKRFDEALQAGLHYVHLEPTGEYAAEIKSLILSVKLSQEHPLVLQKNTPSEAGFIPVKQ